MVEFSDRDLQSAGDKYFIVFSANDMAKNRQWQSKSFVNQPGAGRFIQSIMEYEYSICVPGDSRQITVGKFS